MVEQETALADPAMPLMSLPSLILENVSAISGCPPAIYSLGMTCVHMYGAAGDAPAQATTLLRAALHASLQHVLKNMRVRMATVSFAHLRKLDGTPTAIISGSAVLQAVLGEHSESWEGSDIDIFCTLASLPSV